MSQQKMRTIHRQIEFSLFKWDIQITVLNKCRFPSPMSRKGRQIAHDIVSKNRLERIKYIRKLASNAGIYSLRTGDIPANEVFGLIEAKDWVEEAFEDNGRGLPVHRENVIDWLRRKLL